MNWLKNFVRPKLRGLVGGQKEIPDNLWHKCPACSQMIFHRDLEKNINVCQHCGHHMRIGAKARLDLLFDSADYRILELPEAPTDPLKFRDLKKYTDRLKENRAKTEMNDALTVAQGEMGGLKVVIAAFDFQFMGGSMGMAVGEGLVSAARLAVAENASLVVVPSSGGARMQEGIHSLMQLPRSTIAVNQVKEAGLPYIVVLTDPTTGGVSASFAMLGDIAIAEPGCVIGFAGQRVIEQTIRETLPDNFQRAEYLLEHGMIDMVVRRHELRSALIRVLGLLLDRPTTGDPESTPANDEPEIAVLPPPDDIDALEAPPPDRDPA